MIYQTDPGCGFKYFLFSPLFGEDSHFDEYFFPDGLKSPPSDLFPVWQPGFLLCKLPWDQEDNIEETEIGRLGLQREIHAHMAEPTKPRTDFLHVPPNIQKIGYT